MSRKVTTEYNCDACGVEVETARDLQKFRLEQVKYRGQGEIAVTELCDDCEARFLAALEFFFTGDEIVDLHAMRRED
jgi:hypothetical protein